MPGRVVILNGASSAGKTTIASRFRETRGPAAAAVSIDQLYPWVSRAHPNDWKLYATLTDAIF